MKDTWEVKDVWGFFKLGVLGVVVAAIIVVGGLYFVDVLGNLPQAVKVTIAIVLGVSSCLALKKWGV